MKAVILNDTHFGFKNDSSVMLEYFLTFFETQLFPYMKENDIKLMFHLGDLFDRRKYINFKTLNEIQKRFLEPLKDMGVRCHIICGNHDTYYRNTNKINSLDELVASYPNWSVYSEPTELQLSTGCVALLPWINQENEDVCASFLSNTTCSILLGHLELAGFQTIRGIFVDIGYDPKPFQKFEYVLTGHYHVKSSRDNIHYLGSQYDMGFSDVDEKKGFHVFDFQTRELSFIKNEHKIFFKLEYDEDNKTKVDFEKYKNCFVRIVIKKMTKQPLFEKYLDKLYEIGVVELSVAEDVTTNPELVAVDIHKDTLQLLYEEIDTISDNSINKTLLASIINSAYNTALSKEEE